MPSPTYSDMIIDNSRKLYALPKAMVEEKIASEWLVSSLAATRTKVSQGWDVSPGRDNRPLRQGSAGESEPRSPRLSSGGVGPRREASAPRGASGGGGMTRSSLPPRESFNESRAGYPREVRRSEPRRAFEKPNDMPRPRVSERLMPTSMPQASTPPLRPREVQRSEPQPRVSVLAKLSEPKREPSGAKNNPDISVSEKEAEKLRQALRERLRSARKEK